MFGLKDIRKSKVWQEAFQEGYKEGLELARRGIEEGKARARKEFTKRFLAKGISAKEIADLLDVPLKGYSRGRRVSPSGAIRNMPGLRLTRKSKAPHEAGDPEDEKCIATGRARVIMSLAEKMSIKGKPLKEIAALMDMSVRTIRQLLKGAAK